MSSDSIYDVFMKFNEKNSTLALMRERLGGAMVRANRDHSNVFDLAALEISIENLFEEQLHKLLPNSEGDIRRKENANT